MSALGAHFFFNPHCPITIEPEAEELVGEHLGEHPLIRNIRAKILAYRCQSAGHFANEIAADIVTQALPPETPIGLVKGLKLRISFGNHIINEVRNCRPLFRKDKLTKVVQVREKNRWVTLTNFLALFFPPDDALVTEYTMKRWWDENGKTFNWMGLPKELKLKIIQFCIPYPNGIGIPSPGNRKYRKQCAWTFNLFEIMSQLGAWSALLHASAELRADTLRLILVHNDNCPGGLIIRAWSPKALQFAMDRLGRYYQMVEPNGVPTGPKEQALARRYLVWPKVYPELSRFATLMHGICRLSLKFEIMELLGFFRSPMADRNDKVVTCDVFQKLPNLNKIYIQLPIRQGRDGLCTRKLHRLIFERAAVELAPYENFVIRGFVDEEEVARFQILHEDAVEKLKTEQVIDEDIDGGVLLDPEQLHPPGNLYPANLKSQEVDFPPACTCVVPCFKLEEELWKKNYAYRSGRGLCR